MSPIEAPVSRDHPLMKAWEKHKQTPEYENSKKWAANPKHLEGSFWALFEAGWFAGQAEGDRRRVLVEKVAKLEHKVGP